MKTMYKFFNHCDKWRYRDVRDEVAREVDTFGLEKVLGVLGGPLVHVYRKKPESGIWYRIELENGFITGVFQGPISDLKKGEGQTVTEFLVEELE